MVRALNEKGDFMEEIFHEESKIILAANNKNLNKKWSLIKVDELNGDLSTEFKWIYDEFKKDFKRTNILLGYDNFKSREVIAKNVQYSKEKSREEQKEILDFQRKLLNDLKSPMLPKLLDFFSVKDSYEVDYIKKNDPFIILEYKSGETLEIKISNKEFIKNKENSKSSEVDIIRIVKIVKGVINFNKDLENKGYVHLGISPEHIVLSNEDKVSFLGLGRICNIKNGVLDSDGVNFSRSLFGYSAPELNDPNLHWGKDATAREVSVFSLGVLVHQLICGDNSFSQGTIENGSFHYPNKDSLEKVISQKNGHRISNLIERLCNHNPKKRLLDYDEIESILDDIIVDPNTTMDLTVNPFFLPVDKELVYKNLKGYISSFNIERGHGFVRCNNGEDFYLRKEEIKHSNLKDVKEGMEILFDVAKDSSGKIFVCNIKGENCAVIDLCEDNDKENEDEYEDYYEYKDESVRVRVFENILMRISNVFKKNSED